MLDLYRDFVTKPVNAGSQQSPYGRQTCGANAPMFQVTGTNTSQTCVRYADWNRCPVRDPLLL